MAKQEVYDANWFRKNVKKQALALPKNIKFNPVKKGRPSANENPIIDSVSQNGERCKIVLVGLAPGMNGSDGLMREHWTKGMKRRDAYVARISAMKVWSIDDPVKVTYTRYCSLLSDWDNACASFKKIGDALVLCKVIKDDSPEYITEFIPKQIRCRRKDQRTEIFIEKIS